MKAGIRAKPAFRERAAEDAKVGPGSSKNCYDCQGRVPSQSIRIRICLNFARTLGGSRAEPAQRKLLFCNDLTCNAEASFACCDRVQSSFFTTFKRFAAR